MSRATYFVRECPTCGRSLQVRVEYLGKQLVCEHCRGSFHAVDPAQQAVPASLHSTDVLDRAEQLLAAFDSQPYRTR